MVCRFWAYVDLPLCRFRARASRLRVMSLSIKQIVASVADESMGLIKACSLIEERLTQEGLTYPSQLNPRMVGLGPSNRDGMGANVQEVLPLAHQIAFAGFNWKLCGHAVCVEVTPKCMAVEEFNVKLATSGHLAPVVANSIGFGSLACGHTNMGLRAIAAQLPTDSVLLGRGGVCDVQHLRERDPEFAAAVDLGLHWLVLRAEVRTKYPEVLPIIQVHFVVVQRFVVLWISSYVLPVPGIHARCVDTRCTYILTCRRGGGGRGEGTVQKCMACVHARSE